MSISVANLTHKSYILSSKSHIIICCNFHYRNTNLSSDNRAHLIMKECKLFFTGGGGGGANVCVTSFSRYCIERLSVQ